MGQWLQHDPRPVCVNFVVAAHRSGSTQTGVLQPPFGVNVTRRRLPRLHSSEVSNPYLGTYIVAYLNGGVARRGPWWHKYVSRFKPTDFNTVTESEDGVLRYK